MVPGIRVSLNGLKPELAGDTVGAQLKRRRRELGLTIKEAAAIIGVRTPAKKTSYLFSGLAHCECGPKMYVPARRNKIPVGDLEAVFQSQLEGFALSPKELAAHDAAANGALHEKVQLIEAIEAELKRLGATENTLFDLYHAGELPRSDFGRRHKPIAERRAQLDDELPRLQAECDVLRIGLLSREEVLAEAGSLSTQWEDFSFEQRRQIVETICERITIGKEGVEISLLHAPFGTSGEMATQRCRSHAARKGEPPLVTPCPA